MRPRLIICKWKDAHYVSDEADVDEAHKRHKSAVYWSAGILVKSDEEGLTLAMDFGLPVEETDKHSWRTRSFIPRVLILEEIDGGVLIRKVRDGAARSARQSHKLKVEGSNPSPASTLKESNEK